MKLPSPSVKPINQVKNEKEGDFLFIIRSYSELNKVKSKYLFLLFNEDKELYINKLDLDFVKNFCGLI
jgi:hypothetical protein